MAIVAGYLKTLKVYIVYYYYYNYLKKQVDIAAITCVSVSQTLQSKIKYNEKFST